MFYWSDFSYAEREVTEWNTRRAMALYCAVKERHGRTPDGFWFETRIVAKPITDGLGSRLLVESRRTQHSCVYYINHDSLVNSSSMEMEHKNERV